MWSLKFAMQTSEVNAVERAQVGNAAWLFQIVGIGKPMSILRLHNELKFSNIKS